MCVCNTHSLNELLILSKYKEFIKINSVLLIYTFILIDFILNYIFMYEVISLVPNLIKQ